jgi:hypothetical protein
MNTVCSGSENFFSNLKIGVLESALKTGGREGDMVNRVPDSRETEASQGVISR